MTGSGEIEFPEFLQLSAKFLIEEDEEAMLKELKEAFRLYDKEGERVAAVHTASRATRWSEGVFCLTANRQHMPSPVAIPSNEPAAMTAIKPRLNAD